MRISDWSSDVCSSDLDRGAQRRVEHRHRDRAVQVIAITDEDLVGLFVHLHVEVTGRAATGAHLTLGGEAHPHTVADTGRDLDADLAAEIGRASGRESVCQYV